MKKATTITTRTNLWKLTNETIGTDFTPAFYVSLDEAIDALELWLLDEERVEVVTDLSALRGEDVAQLLIIRLTVKALMSHAHQTLMLERIKTGDCGLLVQTVRQGQEDPEPEQTASEAMLQHCDDSYTGITIAEKAEIDLCLEQRVAGALGTLLSPYLEKDRARLSLKEIVEKVAELMNAHCPPSRPVYSTGVITECIVDRLASEELYMRLDGTAGYTDKRHLSYRFLATIEEALSEKAYINWSMTQVKVVTVRDAGEASGYKHVLQLRRAYH
jgi:hypothetical protein